MSEGIVITSSGSPVLKKSYYWYVDSNGTVDLTTVFTSFVKVRVLPTSYTSFYLPSLSSYTNVYYPDTILMIGEEAVVTIDNGNKTTWDHRIKLVNSKTLRSFQKYPYGNANYNHFYLELVLE